MRVCARLSVCVCECGWSLCNETPEVSEGHSGVTEERMGAREEVFLHCCTAVETVALSLSLSYSRLFSGIYNRPAGGI